MLIIGTLLIEVVISVLATGLVGAELLFASEAHFARTAERHDIPTTYAQAISPSLQTSRLAAREQYPVRTAVVRQRPM
jgi:hypothetical protein